MGPVKKYTARVLAIDKSIRDADLMHFDILIEAKLLVVLMLDTVPVADLHPGHWAVLHHRHDGSHMNIFALNLFVLCMLVLSGLLLLLAIELLKVWLLDPGGTVRVGIGQVQRSYQVLGVPWISLKTKAMAVQSQYAIKDSDLVGIAVLFLDSGAVAKLEGCSKASLIPVEIFMQP